MQTDKPSSYSLSSYADIILGHIPVGVALYDATTFHLLAANSLFQSFLSLDLLQHPVGQPLEALFPEAVTLSMLPAFQSVAKTGESYHVEGVAYEFPNDETCYWNWTLRTASDEDPLHHYLVQTIRDVTDQIHARQQADQAKASLKQVNRQRKRLEVIETVAHSVRDVLDTQSIGRAATMAIGTHFRTVCVIIHIDEPEQQGLRMLDVYARPDKAPLLRADFVPYHSSLFIAQGRHYRDPIIIENVAEARQDGRVSPNHRVVELGANGYICTPLWFKDRFEGTLTALFESPIQEDGTEVDTLSGSGTYIAAALAHARLHAEVERERARLRVVLDQSPEGVMLVEAETRQISYANEAAAQIINVARDELVGHEFASMPRVETVTRPNGPPLKPSQHPIARALDEQITTSQELCLRVNNAQILTLLCSTAPIYTEKGTLNGAVTVFQDISTQKSLEQQKNEFISIASHELRTPITAIQGFAEILQLKSDLGHSLNTSRCLHAIKGITVQSQLLTRLIDEMLDIGRIEKAQISLTPAYHYLSYTVQQVIEGQMATTKNHLITFRAEGIVNNPDFTCLYDEGRLIQILNNLIGNAIKYSPEGGEINVGLRYVPEKDEELLLWVKDQGIGIAKNDQAHIFKRFHRASSFDRSISGLGIGLYMVKELVSLHGGHVWVESSEGMGSTFYFTLPYSSPPNVI